MEKMIRGKSILNPYATPYVPLSKLSTGMSYEKAFGANYSSYDNKRTDDLSAEYQLPESVSVDYDIQCFEKLNISGESSSNPSQQYFSVNVLHDDFAEYENRNVISNQSTMLESLSSIFPDISIESLAELLWRLFRVLILYQYPANFAGDRRKVAETTAMEAPLVSDSGGGVSEALGSPVDDPNVEVPVQAAASSRVEIDTSPPFDSVKEAVDRFGGSGNWKTQLKQSFLPEETHCFEEADISELEEQAAEMRKYLIVKERETLAVLKELEMTKNIADGLKLKLKASSKAIQVLPNHLDKITVYPPSEADECYYRDPEKVVRIDVKDGGSNLSARLVLMELEQTTVNLNRATKKLADIKASFVPLHSELREECLFLEKTREKLTHNSATATSLEEEINQATEKLQRLRYLESRRHEDPSFLSQEIKQTKLDLEHSRKMGKSAKTEVTRLTSEVEQTKTSVKTAEIRWITAKKTEAAARTAEAVGLAELEALLSTNSSIMNLQNNSSVTLSVEKYSNLLQKAQESYESSRRRIEIAMQEVDIANQSNAEVVMKMEQATAAMKACKKALEDALTRVENANRGKLAVEEALRRWRSEHNQKRRHVRNSTKFKNPAAHHSRNSRMFDLNGSSLISDTPNIDLSPPMSIGQILSMKRMVPESYEDNVVIEKENGNPKVSLGEMLGKDLISSSQQTQDEGSTKKPQTSTDKRKKLGFVDLSRLLTTKQSKRNKKKRPSFSSR